MTRECPVRFCERLGVKLPGATLPTGIRKFGVLHEARRVHWRVGVEKVSVFFGVPWLTPHQKETAVGLSALRQWQVSGLLLAHSGNGPVV
jgi:hypothetical protein